MCHHFLRFMKKIPKPAAAGASQLTRPACLHGGMPKLPRASAHGSGQRLVLIDPPISPQPGMTGRFAFSDITYGYLAELERRSDFELHLVSSAPQPAWPLTRTQFHGVPAGPSAFRNVVTQGLLYTRYARLVRRLNPQLVYSPDYYSLAVAASLNRRAVALLTTPGAIAERRATFNPYDRSYTLALEWATRTLRARGAQVLATSPYMAQWWQRSGFSARDTHLVPLPTRLQPLTGKAAARGALGWPEGGLHLLSVAAFRPEMRLDLTLGLVARLAAQAPELAAQLHLVGDGPERAHLEALAAQPALAGRVQFHGGQSERLPTFYAAADLLLVGRRHNATPRAAQEALCAGTPVLANRTASLDGFSDDIDRWVRQLDFETQPPDAVALQALVQQVRADDGRAVAQAARAVFGPEATGQAFLNAVSTLAGRLD